MVELVIAWVAQSTLWAASVWAADPVPADEDVVAGGWGAVMFVALILATAFLGWSFTRQIRKVDAAKKAGVYDDKA